MNSYDTRNKKGWENILLAEWNKIQKIVTGIPGKINVKQTYRVILKMK